MKKTLALFGLVAISVTIVVLTVVHGQNSNNGGPKFRRVRAEKRIANQYIVVLKDDVADVEGEAFVVSDDRDAPEVRAQPLVVELEKTLGHAVERDGQVFQLVA